MKFILNIIAILSLLFLFSCQESEDQAKEEAMDSLDEDLPGLPLADLFFDFNQSLDNEYAYYTIEGLGYGNTILDECLLRETDNLNLYTFPEYLLETKNCDNSSVICSDDDADYEQFVQNYLLNEKYENDLCTCRCLNASGAEVGCASTTAVSVDYSSPATQGQCQNKELDTKIECENLGWVWFENEIDCSLMDVNEDCVMDEAQISDIYNEQDIDFQTLYRNWESLTWSEGNGYYIFNPSQEYEISFEYIDSTDLYNKSNYWTIINEWDAASFSDAQNPSGMFYLDHKQWNDTTITIYETDLEGNNIVEQIDTTFVYDQLILQSDSLMYRMNSDCDNNGSLSDAEAWDDFGVDGCADADETGYWKDENGDIQLPNNKCVDEIPCDPSIAANNNCQGDLNQDNWSETLNVLDYTEGNLQYDEGESFTDLPDGLFAKGFLAEPYYDINGNNEWDSAETAEFAEPYLDLNCNDSWDSGEAICADCGNGIWDSSETFIDNDNNGDFDPSIDFLQSRSQSPNQIILNFDTNGDDVVTIDEMNAPVMLDSIVYETSTNSGMVYINGDFLSFVDLGIMEVEQEDKKIYTYNPKEEELTIFSNQIVEDVSPELANKEYFIVKTLWDMSNTGVDVDGDGISDRDYDYDYHLFRYSDSYDALTVNEKELDPGQLLKLIHPSYYDHYGYWYTPDELETFFFDVSDLIEDIAIYTVDGMIRDGEFVELDEETVVTDSNNDGVLDHEYRVNKSFSSSVEEVTVPLREILGTIVPAGSTSNNCANNSDMIVCAENETTSCIDGNDDQFSYNQCGTKIKELSHCSADSTFTAYKITRIKEITLVGNDATFGERNTIWIAEGLGIVKDKLEHRWPGFDWEEFSRLELRNSGTGSNNSLNRMLGGYKILDINKFEHENSLNNDPFIPNPTAIIQRSKRFDNE